MNRGGHKGAQNSSGEGDWICSDPECNNVNFARRIKCNRCGKDKKPGVAKIKTGGIEIGKNAAEKSKGLFSADDWQCKTCGNVNWARRHECNMCKTPKVGRSEERTGLGGGYKENTNIEYIERNPSANESDDEFDEFGRRRKKFRSNTYQSPVSSIQVESDDESGEESDLDQYKLDSEDEDKDDGNDNPNYDLPDLENPEESSHSHQAKRSPSNSNLKSASRSRSASVSSNSSSTSSSSSSDNSSSSSSKSSKSKSSKSST